MNREFNYVLATFSLCIIMGIAAPSLHAQRGMKETFQWSSIPEEWTIGGIADSGVAIFSPMEYPQAYEISVNPPATKQGLIIGMTEVPDSANVVFADLTTTWEYIPFMMNVTCRVLGPIRENDGVFVSMDGGLSFAKIFTFSPETQDTFKLEQVPIMSCEPMKSFRSPQTIIVRFQKEVQGSILAEVQEDREGLWLNEILMGDIRYLMALSKENAPQNNLYASSPNSMNSSIQTHTIAGLIHQPIKKYHFLTSDSDPGVLDQVHNRTEPVAPDTFTNQDYPLIMYLPASGWDVDQENSLARIIVFEDFDSLPRLRVIQGPDLETLIRFHDSDSVSMMEMAIEFARDQDADYLYHAHIDTTVSEVIYDANGQIGNLDLVMVLRQYLIRVSDGKIHAETIADGTNSNNKIRALNSVTTLAGSVAAVSENESTAALGSEILQAQMNTGGVATQLGNSEIMPKVEKLVMKMYMDPLLFIAKSLVVKGKVFEATYLRKGLFKGYEIKIGLGSTHGLREGAGLLESATVVAGMWDGYTYLTSDVKFCLSSSDDILAEGKVFAIEEDSAVVRVSAKKAERLLEALETRSSDVFVFPVYR